MRLPDQSVLKQPIKIIADTHARIPLDAQILENGVVWLMVSEKQAKSEKFSILKNRGIDVIALPEKNGKIDLNAMMQELARREINHIHIEAGSILGGALLEAELVDELLVYLAPNLLGPGKEMVH